MRRQRGTAGSVTSESESAREDAPAPPRRPEPQAEDGAGTAESGYLDIVRDSPAERHDMARTLVVDLSRFGKNVLDLGKIFLDLGKIVFRFKWLT